MPLNVRAALGLLALGCTLPVPAPAASRFIRPVLRSQATLPTRSVAARRVVRDVSAAACAVTAGQLAFPNVLNSPLGALSFSVTCPSGTGYTISLLPASGCAAPDTLNGKLVKLPYQVLTPDASGVWCDGSAGTATLSAVGTGLPQTYRASASLVNAPAIIPAGTYTAGALTIVITPTPASTTPLAQDARASKRI